MKKAFATIAKAFFINKNQNNVAQGSLLSKIEN
jgi:hypothetical protein